jgi:DNA-binding response OmpR family regulator
MATVHLLLVEDDADSAEAISLLLRMQGMDVKWAASGAEALVFFRAQPRPPIDVILLDLMLPDMDGAVLVDRIAEVAPVPPIVIHSAAPLDAAQAAGKRVGAVSVLRKPTDWRRMKEVLEGVATVPGPSGRSAP